MTTKHTPGPLLAYDSGPCVVVLHEDGTEDGRTVAMTPKRNKRSTDEDRANARLYAAAPDLLAVLEAFVSSLSPDGSEDRDHDPDWLADARAAIAKATGT